MDLLREATIFLATAVVAVPLFRRLGLGSVLGYLAGGILIGPSVLGLVSDWESILHFAEFGVVLLLFLVGLELEPSRLWSLRRQVFGAGAAQVFGAGAVLALGAWLLGLGPGAAAIAGVGLALSSTAAALQLLAEKRELDQPHGRLAFAILLFQDLAAIPALAAIPLLAPGGGGDSLSLAKVAPAAGVLVGLVAASRFLLRPAFRWIAATKSQELFTAFALLVVVGTSLLMHQVGLSMALGAFVAGVLLADSEYRHELEADIEPFKGLLLGLFFLAVGMSVNLRLLLERPLAILALVAALVAVKAALHGALGKLAGLGRDGAVTLGVSTSQGGEFAFVLFGAAAVSGVLAREVVETLALVVTLSMATTPLLFAGWEKVVRPRLGARAAPAYDASPKDDVPVIVAGFGRFGQVIGRILRAKRVRFTALDASAEHIDFMQRFGAKLYYGDASRLELLRAAQAEKAKLLVVAVDDVEASLRIVHAAQKHFPHLRLFARARNRQHAYRLMEAGVERVFRETFLSSLEAAGLVLEQVGFGPRESELAVRRFRLYDEELLRRNFQHHKDVDKLQALARDAARELEELFERDAERGELT